jgi:hypothetical protein
LPLLIALVVGCGGKSFEAHGDSNGGSAGAETGGSDSGGSGSVGGSTTGGKSHGGTHGGGTSSGGETGGVAGSAGSAAAGSGGEACEPYLNETGSAVQVSLINDTDVTIYLGPRMPGCTGEPLVSVTNASGELLAPGAFCTETCENHIQGTIIPCPPILCPINSVLALKPGENVMEQWSGAYAARVMLPPTCRAADGTVECQRIEGVKPGVYTFTAQAGAAISCAQTGTGTCPACQPEATGGCVIPGAVVSGEMINATTKVMLDGSYGVGGPGGGGMVRAVEVTFKN